MAGQRLWTKNFLLLCLVNFFLYCSFYLYLPTLPLFIVDELGGTEDQVGVIIGIFTVSALIIRPWTGILANKSGRRPVLLLSLLFFSVILGGYLLAYSILILLVIRLFHGGTFGLTTTIASTVVADVVPETRRGEGLGYFVTITMIAMAVGPVIGPQIVSNWSYTVMFIVSLLISLLSLMLANFVKFDGQTVDESPAVRINLKTMYEPRVLSITFVMMFLAFGFGGVLSFTSLYALQLGGQNLSGLFFMVFALALVVSRPLSGKLYDRLGSDVVIYPSIILYFMGVMLLGLTNSTLLFLSAGFLIGSGYGSLQPSLQGLSIDLVEIKRRGAAMATFLSAVDLGVGIGSMLLGFVVKFLGYQMMFFTICAFILIAGWLYYRARLKEQDINEEVITRSM